MYIKTLQFQNIVLPYKYKLLNSYLHDINSPIYFHQSTEKNFHEICCHDYFHDAVKYILMPPQD